MLIIRFCRDISFGLMVLCFVGFSAAFCSSYWYHQEHAFMDYEVHSGLWRMCDDWLDTCFKVPGSEINSAYLKATQFMMCVALCLYIASTVCYGVWSCQSVNYLKEHGTTPVGIAAVSLFTAAGVFTTIAVAIFGGKCPRRHTTEPFGWSFATAITSSCCSVISGVPILVVILKCVNRHDRQPLSTGTQIPMVTAHVKNTTAGGTVVVVTQTTQHHPGGHTVMQPQSMPPQGYAGQPPAYQYQATGHPPSAPPIQQVPPQVPHSGYPPPQYSKH